jgi:hypothetical protein
MENLAQITPKLLLEIAAIFGGVQVLVAALIAGLSKVWINRLQEMDRRKSAEMIELLRNTLTMEREILLEKTSQHHQLRMAALDRRLEVHQQAYALWWKLLNAVHREENPPSDITIECQDWWVKNGLYLDAEARQAFRDAYIAASFHREFCKPPRDIDAIKENWNIINNAGKIIVKTVELPSLGEEFKPVDNGSEQLDSQEKMRL